MRYSITLMLLVCVMSGGAVFGKLRPQRWDITSIPTEWHDALAGRLNDIAALPERAHRLSCYLELLQSVCAQNGLSEADHSSLATYAKDEVFKVLLAEVKDLAATRNELDVTRSQQLMELAQSVQNMEMDSRQEVARSEHTLDGLLHRVSHQLVEFAATSNAPAEYIHLPELSFDSSMRVYTRREDELGSSFYVGAGACLVASVGLVCGLYMLFPAESPRKRPIV